MPQTLCFRQILSDFIGIFWILEHIAVAKGESDAASLPRCLAASLPRCLAVTAVLTMTSSAAWAQTREVRVSDRRVIVRWIDARAAHQSRERGTPQLEALRGRIVWISEYVDGLSIVDVEPGLADLALELLLSDSNVAEVGPDVLGSASAVPNDPSYPQQFQQYVSFKTCLETAWNVRTKSTAKLIAVLDSGENYILNDMISNQWLNTGEIPGNCQDDEGDSIKDDVRGAEFLDPLEQGCESSPACAPNSNPDWGNFDSHGGYVTSIIGASGNNGLEISGIAWTCQLLPVRIWGCLGGPGLGATIMGIEYALKRGAGIVNCSWEFTYFAGGTPAIFNPLRDVMASDPRVLYVVAAGNTGATGVDLDSTSGPGFDRYPQEFTIPNMIVVGGSNPSEQRVFSSNWGAISVDVFAPGESLIAMHPLGGVSPVNGTSFAAPIVAGVAALVWSEHPTWTTQQVKNQLMIGGDVYAGLNGICVGLGGGQCTRCNPAKALGVSCP